MRNRTPGEIIAMVILYGVCVPILMLFYIIKQLVELFTLPMTLYYAYRIMHTLASDMHTWKSIAEVAEESNAPYLQTKRLMLALSKEHLLWRPRTDEVPHAWSEEERKALYHTKPSERTWMYYEFRLKISKLGAVREETHSDTLLVPV